MAAEGIVETLYGLFSVVVSVVGLLLVAMATQAYAKSQRGELFYLAIGFTFVVAAMIANGAIAVLKFVGYLLTLVEKRFRGADGLRVLSANEFRKDLEADLIVEIELDDCLFEFLVVFDCRQIVLECFFDDRGPIFLADCSRDVCFLNQVFREPEIAPGVGHLRSLCTYIVPTNSKGFA